MLKKIANVFSKGDKILVWERDYSEDKINRELIYRYPNKKFPNFKDVEKIAVRDYERAIIYKNGRAGGVYDGGVYEIEKSARNLATEIVWFDPAMAKLSWGVGWMGGIPPRTSDGFALGSSGTIDIRIDDPEALMTMVIAGEQNFNDQSLKDLIQDILITSFRNVLNIYTLQDFVLQDREEFASFFKTKTYDDFRKYGIELLNIQVLDVAHPPEDKQMVKKITEDKKIKTDIITDKQKAKFDDILTEIQDKEDQIKVLKKSVSDMELKHAMSEIDDEELNSKVPKMKALISQREKEIEELRNKLS